MHVHVCVRVCACVFTAAAHPTVSVRSCSCVRASDTLTSARVSGSSQVALDAEGVKV